MLKKVVVFVILLNLLPFVGAIVTGMIAGTLDAFGIAVPALITTPSPTSPVGSATLIVWTIIGGFTVGSLVSIAKVVL